MNRVKLWGLTLKQNDYALHVMIARYTRYTRMRAFWAWLTAIISRSRPPPECLRLLPRRRRRRQRHVHARVGHDIRSRPRLEQVRRRQQRVEEVAGLHLAVDSRLAHRRSGSGCTPPPALDFFGPLSSDYGELAPGHNWHLRLEGVN